MRYRTKLLGLFGGNLIGYKVFWIMGSGGEMCTEGCYRRMLSFCLIRMIDVIIKKL
jgi:hypothetical protein